MSYENWKDKIGTFEVMDVRGKKLDFFPAMKAKAAALKNGEGLRIIPAPLLYGLPAPLILAGYMYAVCALSRLTRGAEEVPFS